MIKRNGAWGEREAEWRERVHGVHGCSTFLCMLSNAHARMMEKKKCREKVWFGPASPSVFFEPDLPVGAMHLLWL